MLPTHGVVKENSSTTKLRIIFASSSNVISVNNILPSSPSLYPLLTSVLLKFRSHTIGMSADISKLFREVVLASKDNKKTPVATFRIGVCVG